MLAIAMCKFRTSNHPLEIERRRYERLIVPRFMRKCTLFNLNETGNEYHFLLICPFFSELRNRFIPAKYLRRINFVHVLDLISSKDNNTMLNLAKYIKEALKLYIIV